MQFWRFFLQFDVRYKTIDSIGDYDFQRKHFCKISQTCVLFEMRLKLPTKSVPQISHVRAGKLIRRVRREHGISQWELADSMNISAPYISDLERGRRNWTAERFHLAAKTIRELFKQRKRAEYERRMGYY
jgi:DNA-binding XRE family transcriptional regulator